MNLLKLCESLNDLCELLDSKYDINSGGCCFIASVIAKEFDERAIPYTLMVNSEYKKENEAIADEVQRCLKNYDEDTSVVGFYTCNHYYLKVETKDSIIYINRNVDNPNDFIYEIPVTDYIPIKWIYNHGSWNMKFDIDNCEYIKSLINLIFKAYD